MTEANSSRYSIHQGSIKMYHDLREVYLGNSVKMCIANFVAKGLNCQQVKDEHQRPCGVAQSIALPEWKWEMIDMEFIIGLPQTRMKHNSLWMASYKALYERRCRSPIGWFEVGEAELIGPELIHQSMEKVKIIQERLRTAQSCQKSYTYVRNRDLEFEVDDWVYLRILPIKSVMRFGKKGKLSP
ncbi:uncharacterized protein LOC125877520 [Solanum stenotomum]|uniref:uncharacterized protein LOC125877520 n=1 Tax=Solanum stenotomum TaxID=172797 RepID=UPI0020D054E3|nr:uncharacterized protein LOC125877520 [Solanum stenotomum]